MCCAAGDDFNMTFILQPFKGTDNIAVMPLDKLVKTFCVPIFPISGKVRHVVAVFGFELFLIGLCLKYPSFEILLKLCLEVGVAQLLYQNRCQPKGDLWRNTFVNQPTAGFKERQICFNGRFRQPVGPVRGNAMVKYVRNMRMQNEREGTELFAHR
jgi:hypothetical protein